MAHTPGPWFVRLTDSTKTNYTVEKVTGDLRSIIAGSNAACLCEEHGGDVLSNARLIAYAPDLLEACELIYGMYEWSIKRNRTTLDLRSLDWNVLHNAIAKAKGA